MCERAAIIAEARAWIGTPYRHRASVKGAGADCLGLVRGVWRHCCGREPEPPPPYSPFWAEVGGRETLLEAARRHLVEKAICDALPGDVLLFRWKRNTPAKHAAILVGAERIIHAYEGVCVTESPLAPAWRRRVAAAFAFPNVVCAGEV